MYATALPRAVGGPHLHPPPQFLGFDTAGTPGQYELMFTDIYSAHPEWESLQTWYGNVTSAVDSLVVLLETIEAPGSPWPDSGTVVVGREWDVVPSVRLLDAAGAPIKGKTAALVAPPGLGLISSSPASSVEGWIHFAEVDAVLLACVTAGP